MNQRGHVDLTLSHWTHSVLLRPWCHAHLQPWQPVIHTNSSSGDTWHLIEANAFFSVQVPHVQLNPSTPITAGRSHHQQTIIMFLFLSNRSATSLASLRLSSHLRVASHLRCSLL